MSTRRTNEELKILFEQKGLAWVREQLETMGGEINVLETPYAKVWVKNEKDRQKKREKIEERIWNLFWNLFFLIIGAGISAFVAWGTTNSQLSLSVDPVIEISPSNIVKGEDGNFVLSIRNRGIADLYNISIYEDYFVTETLGNNEIVLVSIGPRLTFPNVTIKDLTKAVEKKITLISKPALEQMAEFYKDKPKSLQMKFLRLTIKFNRKVDGKGFTKTKAYIIDYSGSVFMDYQERGIRSPYTVNFDDVKRILGVGLD
jgi:hypothetical protein